MSDERVLKQYENSTTGNSYCLVHVSHSGRYAVKQSKQLDRHQSKFIMPKSKIKTITVYRIQIYS